MNGLQSIHFKHFTPPVLEPVLAPKSIVFWSLNILTVGIYGAAETLARRHRVKELELIQEDLHNQVIQLVTHWGDLERDLTSILDQLRNEGDVDVLDRLKGKVDKLSMQKDSLQEESLKSNVELDTSFSDVALGTIAFVGQLIANILTLGLYGVYQNYALKNRITVLEAQNEFIQGQFENQKEEKLNNLQRIIDTFHDFVAVREETGTLREQFNGIKDTDQGKAYFAAQQAQLQLANAQKEHANLTKQVTALKLQNAAVEKGKKDAEAQLSQKTAETQNLRARVNAMSDEEWRLKQERDQLKGNIAKKDGEIQNLQVQKRNEVANIQVQLNAANAKAARVQQLEQQIANMQKYQPEVVKLTPQLGPIPPKYIPRTKDKEKPGAMDLEAIRDDLEQEQIQFYEEYNNRYADKRSASEVIVESFNYAYDQLLDMAASDNKIKLNNAGNTMASPCAMAIYSYMALDLIRGAKIAGNGCHGFMLKINGNVTMLPSHPNRVMQYKDDQMGGMKPEVVVRYTQIDDFTPDVDVLGVRDGVNAPAIKWIYDQLSDQEREYLFTYLMASVIEDTHPDYQKMRAFMENSHDPRVALVLTAAELIEDIATSFQMKFGNTVLVPCWMDKADDWDIEPFVKPQDDLKAIKGMMMDEGLIQSSQGSAIVDWEIDMDVLGDKRNYELAPRQREFADLIIASKKKYQALFDQFDSDLMRHPEQKGKEFTYLDWAPINKQFHVSHQMIGADFNGDGGERCLFSNLLTVLVMNKTDLTVNNVRKLKKAMASYLDKLQQANSQWSMKKLQVSSTLSKEMLKLKEMAELAVSFESEIKRTHNCTVAAYQAWLRNESWGAAPINISNLTPLEIQLGAFTMGVRICLIPIKAKCLTKVDNFGRIVPNGEYYGPHTKELLFMGCYDPMNGYGGSYYSLFPKLKIWIDEKKSKYNPRLEQNPDVFDAALDLEGYWTSIDINKVKE